MRVADEVLGAPSTIVLVEVLRLTHDLLNPAAFVGLARVAAVAPFEPTGEAVTAFGAVVVVLGDYTHRDVSWRMRCCFSLVGIVERMDFRARCRDFIVQLAYAR